ncbi:MULTISPECIES: DNA polymerase III subunit beta family protein [Streptomyces]|uniref:MerR family DNA-binding transcriptional regulator n=2 Tax=Streptomyces rimosus subsp. rimosus TaxID=132474 RepID=L8F1G7_STRR1|nr:MULTISPECIES: MerR family transcriptional regulator [Streptomyces]KOG70736.1 transcriptional regulator [Kitasatospora aureofaciens]MYT47067.1 MerR family DNA-binding transcriptional regulator [Streptomyces sp. SID5471]KEF08080.1 transcriptional regulator [Streptomyces rimosus]KEF20957.1 transcriptional regulator [Streptomyces rimosus]KOT29899.1 transcriptional regulator [Streptomyces rimosus subsp. rimosus]
MDESEELLGIGAFARRVGLTPSALRFYDDCGVLRPARVDPASGYRFYGAGQDGRGVLLRRLREAGLPLADVRVVLDGGEAEARTVLRAHLERTRRTADTARALVEGLLRDLPMKAPEQPLGRAVVGGAELASAVRQVGPAVADAGTRAEFPVLGCVLIEVDDEELRLVATDRYRLAVRVLRARTAGGGPCRVLVDAAELADLATWALRQQYVDVEVYGDGGCLVGEDGERRAFVGRTAEYPDYRLVLEGLDDVRHRVIVGRAVLRAAFAEREKGAALTTRPGAQEAVISGGGGSLVTVSAVCTGPTLRVAFDPAVLVPALDAGVGPDVLLEIASGTAPVVVRSADQGSFTTLVMPVRERVSRETE